MWPVLFEVGGHAIHTWGVLAATGFLVASAIGLARASRRGIAVERAADALLAGALAAVVGARGLYVIGNLDRFRYPLEWLDLRSGGASFFGGLALAVPVASLVAVLRGVPLAATWDAFAPGLALGFAISRVGCFAAGCCFGAPLGGGVHPTQLYEAAFQVAVGTGLLRARLPAGGVFALWLGATSVGRFFLELVRGDPGRGALAGLTEPQWFAIGGALLAVALGLRIRRVALDRAPPAAGAPGA
jgi:phosphatidylglycerol---prolipoprotein diacylglyceryl transferase